MLDQIGTHGIDRMTWRYDVPVKPHAFGVPLARFYGWTGRRAKQFTAYAENGLNLALAIACFKMN